MNRWVRRPVACCLALTLALPGFLNAACSSSRTPTAPSTTPTGTEPGAAGPLRVISADADSIEVEGTDADMGGSFRLRIEGMQSERPIYFVNGVLAGDLFGDASSTSDTGANGLDDGVGQVSAVQVGLVIIIALSTWTAFEVFKSCAPPVFRALGDGTLGEPVWDECVVASLTTIAAAWGATVLSKCRCIERTKMVIKEWVGRTITWRQLDALLNKRTFSTAVDLLVAMAEQLVGLLYAGMKEAMKALLAEQPQDPPPPPAPDPPGGTGCGVVRGTNRGPCIEAMGAQTPYGPVTPDTRDGSGFSCCGIQSVTSFVFYAAVHDADGDPLTLRWEFGDGHSASGATVSHVFETAGSFDLRLRVSDGRNETVRAWRFPIKNLSGPWLWDPNRLLSLTQNGKDVSGSWGGLVGTLGCCPISGTLSNTSPQLTLRLTDSSQALGTTFVLTGDFIGADFVRGVWNAAGYPPDIQMFLRRHAAAGAAAQAGPFDLLSAPRAR